MEFIKSRGNLSLFIIICVFTLCGILYLADTIVFINTKRVATATVVRVEVTQSPKPYKATMVYHNTFINDNVVSYVDNIGSNYAKKHIDVHNHLDIYYRNYFPREIYLVDYKYPNGYYVVMTVFYLLAMCTLLYFQYKRIGKRIENF